MGNICLVGGVNPAQAQAELKTLGFTQAELVLPVARLSGGQQRRTALLRMLFSMALPPLLVTPVSYTHLGRAHHVHNADGAHAALLTFAQGSQGIGGFAALADNDLSLIHIWNQY